MELFIIVALKHILIPNSNVKEILIIGIQLTGEQPAILTWMESAQIQATQHYAAIDLDLLKSQM